MVLFRSRRQQDGWRDQGVTRTGVLRAIRNWYREASKKDKSRMLDEFVAMVGCHRKHAVRLLRQDDKLTARSVPKGQRI